MTKGRHLTKYDRAVIEHMLNKKCSFRAIAHDLDKDPCTISREVKLRYVIRKTGAGGRVFNDCRNARYCTQKQLCSNTCTRNCSLCVRCRDYCEDYEKMYCPKLSAPPYVCNGCSDKPRCRLEKHYYYAADAQKDYKSLLEESRSGILKTEEEIRRIDDIISPLIRKGQSPYHVWLNNKDRLMISEKTLYNYIDMGLLSVKNIDLSHKVKYKPRKKKGNSSFKVDRKCFINRSYDDYVEFMEEHEHLPVVQIDSVVGKSPGKVFLTMSFVNCNLLVLFLREHNDSRSVTDIFRYLYRVLGHDAYKQAFPVILADRGSEFTNPLAIEFNDAGERISRVFYCDPSSPFQKPAVENCHRLLRRIVPKGVSFNGLDSKDVRLIMSHINSYRRKNLGNKSAMEGFRFMYPSIADSFLDVLGIEEISPNNVILSPDLLK